jgi:murein DD-endopeptidase MepM/ murein hydrolase activator NlpD
MSKKSSMYFSAMVYVFFVVFLIFLLIVVKMKDKNLANMVVGQQALSLFASYQEGEKLYFYVQQSAKYASENAVNTFLKNGGFENPNRILGLANWTNSKTDFKKEFSKIFYNELMDYFQMSEKYIPTEYDMEISSKGNLAVISGIALKNTVLLSGNSIPQNLAWPTGKFSGKYSIASSFGQRIHPITRKQHFHEGIDIDSDSKEIYAADDGTVEAINRGCTNCYYNSETDKSDENCFKCGQSYGNYVLIDHGNFKSLYAHLEEVNVNIGQKVNRGEVIGIMGSSGSSTSPHLHFEIRVNNKNVNPLCYYEGFDIEIKDQKKPECGNAVYSMNLSFNTTAQIDFSVYERLYNDVQQIIKDCESSTNKEECYISKLSSFGYSEECYEDYEKPFYEIMKTINYCKSSLDDKCYCSVDFSKISSLKINNEKYEISFMKNPGENMFIAANLGDKGLKDYFDLIKRISFDNNNFIEDEMNFKIILNYQGNNLRKTEIQFQKEKTKNTNLELLFFKSKGSVYFANPSDYDYLKNTFRECSLRKNAIPACKDGIRFEIKID